MNNDQNNQNAWSNNSESVNPNTEQPQNTASVWDEGNQPKNPEQGIWNSQSIIGNQINIDNKVEEQPVSTPTTEEVDPNLIKNTEKDSNSLSTKNPFIFNKIIFILFVVIILGIISFVTISLVNRAKEYTKRKRTATVSANAYIKSIQKYISDTSDSNGDADSINEYVGLPVLTGSTVDCYTVDGKTWYGKVDESSSTCNEFMSAITKINNNAPQEAYIMFGLKGDIVSGSWLEYDDVYCIYDGNKINNYSKKQPISIPDDEIGEETDSTSTVSEPTATNTKSETDTKKSSGSSSVDAVVSAQESSARTSTLGFIDSVEYYAGFALIDENKTTIPTYNNSNVTCTSEDGNKWSGNVDTNSTTCDQFMKEVITKYKGSTPQEAKIIISQDGTVQSGTWIKFLGYYCLYSNNNVDHCSKDRIN